MSIKNFTVKSAGAAFVLIVAGTFAGLSYGADPESHACPTPESILSFPDDTRSPATIYYFVPPNGGDNIIWLRDSEFDKGLPKALTSVTVFDHHYRPVNSVACTYRTTKDLDLSLYIFSVTTKYLASPADAAKPKDNWTYVNATNTTPAGVICITSDPGQCRFFLIEQPN